MLNTALVEESAVEQIPDNVAAVSGCPGIAGVVTQLWPVAARVHVADKGNITFWMKVFSGWITFPGKPLGINKAAGMELIHVAHPEVGRKPGCRKCSEWPSGRAGQGG